MDSEKNTSNNEEQTDNTKALIRIALIVIIPIVVMLLVKHFVGGK